jgi:diaminopimelate decarboxylase
MDAARRIAAHPMLELTGLHSHIGTFILDPRAYAEQTRILCAFMKKVEDAGLAEIESIDIGGGFPSRNALQGVYLPPEQAVPEIEDYAEAVTRALIQGTDYRKSRGLPRPILILESGRHVVDDSQWLVSSVVGTKQLPDGRRAAVLDAGVNLLFTAYWYNHPVRLARAKRGAVGETVLYGPLCMNIDIMRHSVALPPLSPGDALVFGPTGAYNNTQWMQFIEYRPNIVLIHADGGHSVIRRAEDLEVMCRQDELPEHLRQAFPAKIKAA